MIPKDKAEELVSKFYTAIPSDEMGLSYEASKDCALIAVNEIINYLLDSDWALINNKANYWDEVKSEINKL